MAIVSPGFATAFRASVSASVQPQVIATSSGESACPQRSARRAISWRSGRWPLGCGVDIIFGALDPRGPRQEAVEPAGRQQFGARYRAAERHQPGIAGIFQQFHHHAGNRHMGGIRRRPRNRRRLQRNRAAPGNIEAGLRPRLQHAAILQQAIGLQRGRQADAPLPADLAQRRRPRSRRQRAAVDQPGDEACELFVSIAGIGPQRRACFHGSTRLPHGQFGGS